MALDFQKLLENPLFQTGLATLGGSGNPGLLNAYQALQAQKKLKLEQQQHEQQAELEKARTDLYRQQIEATRAGLKQKDEEMRRKQENLKNLPLLLQQLNSGQFNMGAPAAPQGGVAGPTMQPGAAAPPPMQPPEPVGKYGTPKRVLSSLMQVESGGNPRAIGPDIGGGIRALGPFQFIPSTISMLKKDGIVFDPFNPQQAEEAADYYIQKLVKEHGGDYRKALAAYGGFKTKDPTNYVNKVLGSPEKQAAQFGQHQAQSQQQQHAQQIAAQYEPSINVDLDSGDIKLDIKPSYERAKVGIQQQELGLNERRTRVQEQEADIKAGAEGRQQVAAQREHTAAKTKDWQSVATTSANLDNLSKKVAELNAHPGLKGIFGIPGMFPDVPGEAAADARTKHFSIVKQLAKETLQSMREASKTGGALGNVSDADVKLLETAIQNLDKAQSVKAAKEAMDDIQKFTARIRNISIESYERVHNESPIEGLPKGARYGGIDSQTGKSFYKLPNGKFVREE